MNSTALNRLFTMRAKFAATGVRYISGWHSRFACAVLFALVSANHAQNVGGTASLEGVVVHSVVSAALEGVIVALNSNNGASEFATTDAAGKFKFNVRAGVYKVVVVKQGFARSQGGSGPLNITLRDGDKLTGIRFQMAPTSVITGRILTPDGKPLAAGFVMALRPAYERGRRTMTTCPNTSGGRLNAGARVETDNQGHYRLYDLPAGEYYVVATSARNCDGPVHYYPGVSNASEAVRVTVRSGVEIGGIDVRIRTEAVFSARFRIVRPPELSASRGGRIQVYRRTLDGIQISEFALTRWQESTDERVVPHLAPGSYDIHFSADELGTFKGHVTVNVIDRDVDAGILVVRPRSDLQGRISLALGYGGESSIERIRIRFSPLGEIVTPLGILAALAPARVSLDGSFSATNLAQGDYHVELLGLGSDTYFTVFQDGRERLDGIVTVDSSVMGSLHITLGGPGGVVEGTAFNSAREIVTDCQILLVPPLDKRGNIRLYKTAEPDQYGSFYMSGIAPGEYSLFAWENLQPGAYLQPGFLEAFEHQAVRLKVSPGATVTTTVRMIPAQN